MKNITRVDHSKPVAKKKEPLLSRKNRKYLEGSGVKDSLDRKFKTK